MTDKLSDDQLLEFDREYVTDARWQSIEASIGRDFSDESFSFIDIGGGNGVFADRVLAAYPNSTGIVLDSSELLLSKNSVSERKKTVLGDAMALQAHSVRVDIVFFNWVLHHLVRTGSYRETRGNIQSALLNACDMLNENGRISVYENLYNGLIDNLPGRIIFELTSLTTLAPLTKKLGANTAGVGVCFLSKNAWLNQFQSIGMKNLTLWEEHRSPVKLPHRVGLLIREVRRAHFWLKPPAGNLNAR